MRENGSMAHSVSLCILQLQESQLVDGRCVCVCVCFRACVCVCSCGARCAQICLCETVRERVLLPVTFIEPLAFHWKLITRCKYPYCSKLPQAFCMKRWHDYFHWFVGLSVTCGDCYMSVKRTSVVAVSSCAVYTHDFRMVSLQNKIATPCTVIVLLPVREIQNKSWHFFLIFSKVK